MPPTAADLQARFVFHLAAALVGRMAVGGVPLQAKLSRLETILAGDRLDLAAGRASLAEVADEWGRQPPRTEAVAPEVQAVATDALKFLAAAVDHVLAGKGDADPDGFISDVLQCSDCIAGLDLMDMVRKGGRA